MIAGVLVELTQAADHASFDEEFAPHEDVHGWWYFTGYASIELLPDIRKGMCAE